MAAEDEFDEFKTGLDDPSDHSIDIDAQLSDTVDLTKVTRAIHVDVGGVIRGILKEDGTTERTFTVNAGALYPYRFKRVFLSTTSATGLIGML